MLKLIIALLIVFLGIFQYKLWIAERGVPDILKLQKKSKQQIAKNQQLKQQNQVLSVEVNELKAGTDAIEERARVELGMMKEDEVFYQVHD